MYNTFYNYERTLYLFFCRPTKHFLSSLSDCWTSGAHFRVIILWRIFGYTYFELFNHCKLWVGVFFSMKSLVVYKNIGFPNEPGVRYRNFFIPNLQKLAHGTKSFPCQGLILWVFFNPRDEEIYEPDTNCIPVCVFICASWLFSQFFSEIILISTLFLCFFKKKIENAVFFQKNPENITFFSEFLHGSCGNRIKSKFLCTTASQIF